MPYNSTQFPNLLFHANQEEAETGLNLFQELIKTDCSPLLKPFLCSMYVPKCSVPGNITKPCQSLCQSAKQGCETEILRLGISVELFSCEDLPQNDDCFDFSHPGKLSLWNYLSELKVVMQPINNMHFCGMSC